MRPAQIVAFSEMSKKNAKMSFAPRISSHT